MSAVAKRRRLNGHVVGTSTTTSTSSNLSQPPEKPILHGETRSQESTPNLRSYESSRSPPVSDQADEANSFSALLSKDIVHFSGFREVGRLGDDAVKIRLSKGQVC